MRSLQVVNGMHQGTGLACLRTRFPGAPSGCDTPKPRFLQKAPPGGVDPGGERSGGGASSEGQSRSVERRGEGSLRSKKPSGLIGTALLGLMTPRFWNRILAPSSRLACPDSSFRPHRASASFVWLQDTLKRRVLPFQGRVAVAVSQARGIDLGVGLPAIESVYHAPLLAQNGQKMCRSGRCDPWSAEAGRACGRLSLLVQFCIDPANRRLRLPPPALEHLESSNPSLGFRLLGLRSFVLIGVFRPVGLMRRLALSLGRLGRHLGVRESP